MAPCPGVAHTPLELVKGKTHCASMLRLLACEEADMGKFPPVDPVETSRWMAAARARENVTSNFTNLAAGA